MERKAARMEIASDALFRLGLRRWAVKTVTAVMLGGACLFLSAGWLDWTMGWVYLGLMASVQVVNGIILWKHSPDLLVERSQVREGTKAWDRVLSVLMAMVGPFAIWITAGLGVRWNRVGVEGAVGISGLVQAAGLGLVALGAWITLWAMASNRFFAATVRIQTERGHSVAQHGPYRFVRHPGYAGAVLFDLATPLALGVAEAFIPAVVTIGVIVLRTALEDRTLLDELSGYREYAARVRFRLLPGVW